MALTQDQNWYVDTSDLSVIQQLIHCIENGLRWSRPPFFLFGELDFLRQNSKSPLFAMSDYRELSTNRYENRRSVHFVLRLSEWRGATKPL